MKGRTQEPAQPNMGSTDFGTAAYQVRFCRRNARGPGSLKALRLYMSQGRPLRRPMCLLFAFASALLAQRDLLPRDPASVQAGKQIYLGSCSGCHGATGEGSQGPSLLSGRASRLPDLTLVNSIKNGLAGTG